ncbi:MAG: XdhC family protein [Pseudomonadota bacterium]
MRRTVLNALNVARAEGRAIALATDLASGEQAVIDGREITGGSLGFGETVFDAAADALRLDTGTVVEDGERRLFLQVFNPPLRLVIVGAVHIAQPLARMASLSGYAVTVVDPRGAFATEERFPDIALSQDWPDEALEELSPDARTAVVALTHDPKIDDPALRVALASPCFYIAALGSRKTHAARLIRLGSKGIDQPTLNRLHGPAGLAIGAKSPAEIAIAIMAQMTQVLRSPTADRAATRAA